MQSGQTSPELAGPFGDGEDVIALAETYRPDETIEIHRHARAQLLYGLTGTVVVEGAEGSWMMPPDCALWIPARQDHSVRMIGEVHMRSLYLEDGLLAEMPRDCAVLAVGALVRSLLEAVGEIAHPLRATRRGGLLVDLLLNEIPGLPVIPLSLPLPVSPGLRSLCREFLADPSAHSEIDVWSARLNQSRRTFTRHFRAETGLSLVLWRQRACVMAAIPRLLAGAPVTEIALDLGYDNPASFTTMFRRVTGTAPSRYRLVHGERQSES